jgi:hypothetical protein
MKVTLAQHGGLAAPINLRLPLHVVDTATLKSDDAVELARLIADATAAPPTGVAPGKARDAMSYTITVEDDGHKAVLSQSDTTMSASFAKLLDWLQRHR